MRLFSDNFSQADLGGWSNLENQVGPSRAQQRRGLVQPGQPGRNFFARVCACAHAGAHRRAPARARPRICVKNTLDRLARLDQASNGAGLRQANLCFEVGPRGEVGPKQMEWGAAEHHQQRSACGYQVTATREGASWLFVAWGPEQDPGLSHWDWLERHAKEHYRRGESVPQRHELLGVRATAAEARALCEQHAGLAARGEAA